VRLNKVPEALIAVGCIREAMHQWERWQWVRYFLARPLGQFWKRKYPRILLPPKDAGSAPLPGGIFFPGDLLARRTCLNGVSGPEKLGWMQPTLQVMVPTGNNRQIVIIHGVDQAMGVVNAARPEAS